MLSNVMYECVVECSLDWPRKYSWLHCHNCPAYCEQFVTSQQPQNIATHNVCDVDERSTVY